MKHTRIKNIYKKFKPCLSYKFVNHIIHLFFFSKWLSTDHIYPQIDNFCQSSTSILQVPPVLQKWLLSICNMRLGLYPKFAVFNPKIKGRIIPGKNFLFLSHLFTMVFIHIHHCCFITLECMSTCTQSYKILTTSALPSRFSCRNVDFKENFIWNNLTLVQ